MENLIVGTRVIVTDVARTEFSGNLININEYREPSLRYCVELDDFADLVFVGRNQIRVAD